MHKPWQTMTIEEISEFVSGGGTPSTKVDSYWNGEVQWLTPSDVTSLNGSLYVSSTSRTITDEGLNSSSAKLYKPGTILMTSRATIGKPVINTVPMATNQGFINFLPKEDLADAEFIVYWIKLNESKIAGMGTGSTFREISKGKFKTVEVSFPNLPTQKKISHILSTIQNKIENIDKQIESFTSLKKSVMEKLFTEGLHNEKQKATEIGMIPESWEIKRLGEVIKLTSGKGLSQKNMIPGEYLVYGGNGISGNHNEYLFEEETLIIGRVGEHCGNVHITQRYSWITDNALLVKDYCTKIDIYYLMEKLKYMNLNQYSNKSAQPVISQSTIYALPIELPKIPEQKEIGLILGTLEQKLELLIRKKKSSEELFNSMLKAIFNQKFEIENIDLTKKDYA